jgi:hypothetical protein
MTLRALAWVGTVSITGTNSFTLLNANVTTAAQTTTTLTTAGTPIVISAGAVRGTFTSSAASVYNITASVVAGAGLTISGPVTLTGGWIEANTGSAVTIGSGATLNTAVLAGAGTLSLDGCSVNGKAVIQATGIISASFIGFLF